MMKNLIYTIFALGLFSLAFISCGDNSIIVEPTKTTTNSGNGNIVTDYCTEIDDWVITNYPQETIDSVTLITNNTEEYVVYLSNGVTAGFDVESCIFLWETVPAPCGCTWDYVPVCWNDSTYNNECIAICDGATPAEITDGECIECDESCPQDYTPVCWNDETYFNECLALCAGATIAEISNGECDCEGACPAVIDPVCWNNTTYDNECLALCAGAELSEIVSGACSGSGCIDGAIAATFPGMTTIDIVTGYGNVMYANAYYQVTLQIDGTQVVVYFGEDCSYYSVCGCDSTVDLVCASGNPTTGSVTYINQCEAECQYAGGSYTSGACN